MNALNNAEWQIFKLRKQSCATSKAKQCWVELLSNNFTSFHRSLAVVTENYSTARDNFQITPHAYEKREDGIHNNHEVY